MGRGWDEKIDFVCCVPEGFVTELYWGNGSGLFKVLQPQEELLPYVVILNVFVNGALVGLLSLIKNIIIILI